MNKNGQMSRSTFNVPLGIKPFTSHLHRPSFLEKMKNKKTRKKEEKKKEEKKIEKKRKKERRGRRRNKEKKS